MKTQPNIEKDYLSNKTAIMLKYKVNKFLINYQVENTQILIILLIAVLPTGTKKMIKYNLFSQEINQIILRIKLSDIRKIRRKKLWRKRCISKN